MRYSLRTLLLAMFFSGPGLAMLWWLRHTWNVQVAAIIVLMLAALMTVIGVLHGVDLLVRLVIGFVRNSWRKPG